MSAEKCRRPGCAGTIEEGYCTDCGLAPAGLAPGTAPSAATPASAKVGSAGSAISTPRSGSVPSSGSIGASTGSRPRTGSTSRSTTGPGLGAGFISLPPLPSMDPMLSIMNPPVVPENKRYCGSCQKKVTRESGFCPHCGKPFDFAPRLRQGDVVGEQYEVKGPIAFGGLGWIYLAQDRRLKQRWVVLKGLLNTQDEASATAALQEREFLSAVKHANIVSVYNFVTHGSDGFIVMEYVGGKTLNDLRKQRGPLPPAEAIAYIHRILSAFAYLHDREMVYCDFKPPNVMLEDDVKLIDMGGVRKVTDTQGEVYGTRGFFAPEIGSGQSPTFSSDLYTVARALALLMIDFDFQKQHQYSIPGPHEEPLFATHDSLFRFLKKATRQNPDERFQGAGEMAEQLLGVLRDVVALTAPARIIESGIFGNDAIYTESDGATAQNAERVTLPVLRVDAEDPAANDVLACAVTDPARRVTYFERTATQHSESAEARLRLAEACIAAGNFTEAERHLKIVAARNHHDWRVLWYRGSSLLKQKKWKDAHAVFDRVYDELPGELASKLAFALAVELSDDPQTAIRLYNLISRCDPGFSTASFGLARCLTKTGDRDGAVNAFERIPASSSAFTLAQMLMTRALLSPTSAPPGEPELLKASETVAALSLDGFRLHELRAELLLKAIERVESGALKINPTAQILGEPLRSDRLRFAAERELRECARYAKTNEEKIHFVDRANQERPVTLV
jgi:serine/threonine-protein kinase PknG